MKRWIAILLPIFALGFLIAWRIHSKNVETATQDQQRAARSKAPAAVSVAAASYQDIVHTFKGIGSVESPFNVKISSKVTGLIDYLQVREGDHVQKGQVLVRIDPTQVQAQNPTNVNVTATIKQQVANLASVQADYDQTVHNYDAQVAAAQATVTDMQGRVDSANSTIS